MERERAKERERERERFPSLFKIQLSVAEQNEIVTVELSQASLTVGRWRAMTSSSGILPNPDY